MYYKIIGYNNFKKYIISSRYNYCFYNIIIIYSLLSKQKNK